MRNSIKFTITTICTAIVVIAGVIYLTYSRTDINTKNKYNNVSDVYFSLCDNINATAVTITENGSEVGVYTLEDLGLLDDVYSDLKEQMNNVDVYSPEEFKDLSLNEKKEWCSQVRSVTEVTVNTSEVDLSCILDDLNKIERIPSKDAEVTFENGKFTIIPEVIGTKIDKDKLCRYIYDKIADMHIDFYRSGSLSLDVKDSVCYIPPKVTSRSISTYDEIFKEQLKNLSFDVVFHNETITLDSEVLTAYFKADSNGKIVADMDGMREYAAEWGTKYNENYVPYLFDSFVDGVVPINFIYCDYFVNIDDTLDAIVDNVVNFSSEPVEAVYDCYNTRGEPFAIKDTYLEVDKKNQHLTFYKNGKLIIDTPVVTGNPNGHNTPVGLYYAHDKQTDRWLTGEDFTVFVNYWVRVYEGYGLHDASWRSAFGDEIYKTNGSHGCVNIPVEAMPLIYENIEDGDPVLIF